MGTHYQALKAADGSLLPGEFLITPVSEVNVILERAQKAFWVYQKISQEQRAVFLLRIAEEIEAIGSALIERSMAEAGLPEARMRAERLRTVNQLKNFSRILHVGEWQEPSINTGNSERPDLRKRLEPIGPVVVFGASNFPLAYSAGGGDTASALAAGCSVIVKAHPAHPGTSEMVAEAIIKAAKVTGMPEHIYQHVHDTGFELGQALVKHPLTTAVGFTGSLTGGRALFDIASNRKHPIPVYAEMGSTNPIVILPNVLKEERRTFWVDQFKQSLTLNCGQFCTNPGLMIAIDSKEIQFFMNDFESAVSKESSQLMLHNGISKAYQEHKVRLKEYTTVEFYYEGKAKDARSASPAIARVGGKAFIENPHLHEEVFGPYSLMVLCEDKEELEAVLHALQGQLTGTIVGGEKELNDYQKSIEILKSKVGRLIFNGVPTGVSVNGSMHHGGPYPATTNAYFSAVGDDAIKRFVRPVTYQNCPQDHLPAILKDPNPNNWCRRINGSYTFDAVQ